MNPTETLKTLARREAARVGGTFIGVQACTELHQATADDGDAQWLTCDRSIGPDVLVVRWSDVREVPQWMNPSQRAEVTRVTAIYVSDKLLNDGRVGIHDLYDELRRSGLTPEQALESSLASFAGIEHDKRVL